MIIAWVYNYQMSEMHVPKSAEHLREEIESGTHLWVLDHVWPQVDHLVEVLLAVET